ncbi:MAG: c-type cytochrome domain-containing protein [Pirellulaceae bacterium]
MRSLARRPYLRFRMSAISPWNGAYEIVPSQAGVPSLPWFVESIAVGIVVGLLACVPAASAQEPSSSEPTVIAENAARPLEEIQRRGRQLIMQHCVACHGPEEQESRLRLDSRDAALTGGEAGPAVYPSDAATSPIVLSLTGASDFELMPPQKPLSDEDQRTIRDWIEWVCLAS